MVGCGLWELSEREQRIRHSRPGVAVSNTTCCGTCAYIIDDGEPGNECTRLQDLKDRWAALDPPSWLS
jgi:hypothetical protein